MPIFKRYIHILIELFLAKITSKLYLVSKEDTLFAKMIGMKNKEDIFYVGNGINSELFKPINLEEKYKAKSKLGLNKENIVIGLVARLVEEKGILDLFDAFRYLIFDIKFTIRRYLGVIVCDVNFRIYLISKYLSYVSIISSEIFVTLIGI